jgi:AcrR family transcriptional regulator
LYRTALQLIRERGFNDTTLRDVAKRAKVSVGLLYRYFPSKGAIVLSLYQELSLQYVAETQQCEAGGWFPRFVFALQTSLRVLAPHRQTLLALVPVMVSHADEGLFSPSTALFRREVEQQFVTAVIGATDAPPGEIAAALGRVLYVAHLAVILWWLLDASKDQRATHRFLESIARQRVLASLLLRLPMAHDLIREADELCQEAFLSAEPTTTAG